MSAIVTNKFRINNALQFYESFGEASPTTYYLFVGRPQSYSANAGGGSDAVPPTPIDNVVNETMIYRDMLAAKKITSSDVSYVVPRHDWVTGTVYDYYRGDYGATVNASTVLTVAGGTDLFAVTTKMYVRSSANNVYKCVWNNGGVASTVEPTGTSTSELTTADGYVWKYMYTMTSTEVAEFLTPDFMGVHTDGAVSAAAVDGEVLHYHIALGGAGYSDGTYSAQALKGDGTLATFDLVVSGGAVTSVTSVAGGSGYTFADIDVDNIPSIGTPTTSAIVTPIIAPKGGHGYNAVEELGGFYVMTNTTLSGAAGSGDFVVDQDFRRVGVVRDPFDYGTTTICTDDTRSALKSVTLTGVTGSYVNDEIITGASSGANAVVVDYDSGSGVLKYIQTEWTGLDASNNLVDFTTSEIVNGAGGASGTVSSVNNPEIDFYSGDIIYFENRGPITRATDQTENIKLIIEF